MDIYVNGVLGVGRIDSINVIHDKKGILSLDRILAIRVP